MNIGIDASRIRSGGAIAHLIGILSEYDPTKHEIDFIHVWSYRLLLEQLPNYPWIVKHNPIALEQSLFRQLLWQALDLARELKLAGCRVLFAVDANTLCRFDPMVVLSQDMLSYEPGVMKSYPMGKDRLRLEIIKHVQNLAFRRSAGVLFLTTYASRIIQKVTGALPKTAVVPHGIDSTFLNVGSKSVDNESWSRSKGIQCIYVSRTDRYKYHWNVVAAVRHVRDLGFPVTLTLIGGAGESQGRLEEALAQHDPECTFIRQMPFIRYGDLPQYLANANIFLFASGCENLPITLLEGMAAGLPIACSNRGPMPEILRNGGVYFDPEDIFSISSALQKLIDNSELRVRIANEGRRLAAQYTWQNCSRATFDFLQSILSNYRHRI
jgi:glycosyltransferase involved in cell wall biosynthesis